MVKGLADAGFERDGIWRGSAPEFREPRSYTGLFALVVDGECCYIGKSLDVQDLLLHRYASHHKNGSGARRVHSGINETLSARKAIEIWTKGLSASELTGEKARLIAEFQPKWRG